jgi:hypothetical protein
LPIYVGAKGGTIWRVVNGKITKLDPKLVEAATAAEEKAAK